MKVKNIDTHNLPSYWAPYLINGDCSHMNDDEIEQCDKYCEGLGSCAEVSEETNFGIFKGIGHTLAEFTFVEYCEDCED